MAAIRLSRVLHGSRDAVWAALTDARALADWLMPNDFEPVVGHRFTFRTDPAPGFDGTVRCEVLEIVERERLRFTWVGGPLDTTVTFTLADEADGTRLTLEHEGFEGLGQLLPWAVLGLGWRRLLASRLAAVLARRPAAGGASVSAPLAARLRRVDGTPAFVRDVPAAVAAIAGPGAAAALPDWLAFGVVDAAAIERVAPEVDARYRRGATLWLIYPKRSGAIETVISRDRGWAPLLSRGFLPVVQVSVDDTWSALRFRRGDEVARVTRRQPIGDGAPQRPARPATARRTQRAR